MIHIGLDIDETIIYTQQYYGLSDRPDDAEHYFSLIDNENSEHFALYLRPHLNEFITFLESNFKIFFYTRADKKYAEKILKFLNIDKYPLFGREETIIHEDVINTFRGSIKIKRYQKDLRIVAKKLKIKINDIIFIDDSTDKAQLLQPELTIKIPEFNGEINDFDLLIIKQHIESGLNYSEENFKSYVRSLNFF